MICDRCRKATNMITMSRFNTDELCSPCEDLERKHPAYKKAQDAEHAEVVRGNYNFSGIGLPADYKEWASNQ